MYPYVSSSGAPDLSMVVDPQHMMLGATSYVGGPEMESGKQTSDPNLSSAPTDQFYFTGDHCLLANGYMDGLYQVNPVASIVFDPFEELIWSVSRSGHLTGYYGWMLQRYISVEVPPVPGSGSAPHLTQVIAAHSNSDHAVFVLARNSIYAYTKLGRLRQQTHHERMQALECLVQGSGSSAGPSGPRPGFDDRLVVGGLQDSLLELDGAVQGISWGSIIRGIGVGPGGCVILKHFNSGLCGANAHGKVMLIDTRTVVGVQQTLEAHSGQISDITVKPDGYTLVTCGWSNRNGMLVLDRLLKVYDLRFTRTLRPVSVMLEPCFVRYVPGFNDRLLVASQTGGFQFIHWGESVPSHQPGQVLVNFDAVTALDISANSRCLVFATDAGAVQLYAGANDPEPAFNHHSKPTIFADPIARSDMDPPIAYQDRDFSFTSVPFATESLLREGGELSSEWPSEFCQSVFRPPVPVPPELLPGAVRKGKGPLTCRKPAYWGAVWHPYPDPDAPRNSGEEASGPDSAT